MILFHEPAAEIVKGIRCLQYADNVFVGAETLEDLCNWALQVFTRFDEYGIKVNYETVKWVSESIQFLGCEVSSGQWSHENFLKRELAGLGRLETIKDVERIIGVISYTSRCVKDVEMILAPIRDAIRTFKLGQVSESRIATLNDKVKEALERAIVNVH